MDAAGVLLSVGYNTQRLPAAARDSKDAGQTHRLRALSTMYNEHLAPGFDNPQCNKV